MIEWLKIIKDKEKWKEGEEGNKVRMEFESENKADKDQF